MRFFILGRYIGRQFGLWLLSIMFTFSFLVAVFDYIELMRRAKNRMEITNHLIAKMVLFHVPLTVQQLMPFAIFFAASLTIWRLGRTAQLAVMRSSGASIWQIATPMMVVTFGYIAFNLGVLNPVGASMMSKFEKMEQKLFHQNQDLFSLSETGVWLRQPYEAGYAIMHLKKINLKEKIISHITIYVFDEKGAFLKRLDASKAFMEPQQWRLQNVVLSIPPDVSEHLQTYLWPTVLNLSTIQNQFLTPETLSFWALPPFIQLMDDAGISSVKHRVYWQSLLTQPLLLLVLLLLGILCAYKVMQRRASFKVIFWSIVGAFSVYILIHVFTALGNALILPVFLATWAPALMSFFLIVALLLHMEEKV